MTSSSEDHACETGQEAEDEAHGDVAESRADGAVGKEPFRLDRQRRERRESPEEARADTEPDPSHSRCLVAATDETLEERSEQKRADDVLEQGRDRPARLGMDGRREQVARCGTDRSPAGDDEDEDGIEVDRARHTTTTSHLMTVEKNRDQRRRESSCHALGTRVTYNHMVVRQQDESAIDRIFAALADATRRDIVTRVLRERSSVSDLAHRYDMTFAAVQKHVAVLERAQLVSKERRGREQLVTGDVQTIRVATGLLGEYEAIWLGRISRIEKILAEPTEGDVP